MDTLFEFARKRGFTGCKSRIPNKYKILYEIQQNPTKWKQHPIYTHLWFEKNTSRCFNNKSRTSPLVGLNQPSRGEKYLISIGGKSSKECKKICNNRTHQRLKWEAFYGMLQDTDIIIIKNKNIQINERLSLNNLECISILCKNCGTLIKNKKMAQKHCSLTCRTKWSQKNVKKRYHITLEGKLKKSVQHFGKWGYSYCLNLVKQADDCCHWCGIKCRLYGNTSRHPDTLSFDAVFPEAGHIPGNLVVSCQFCNFMKHIMPLQEWMDLIRFLKKNGPKILDLSKYKFLTNIETKGNNNIRPCGIWTKLKRKGREGSRKYYKEYGSTFKTFKKLYIKQNGVDSIFAFFPIVYFCPKNNFNVSCDAIDPSFPNEEKHRPNNLQLIPKFLNYGKNDYTEPVIKIFERRNFKTDYSECKVILPEKYKSESWFEYKIQTGKRTGKGRKN